MTVPPALRHPEFRALWSAGLISDAGDWLLFVALPVVVYNLTGSALGTSLAFLVELTPGILLAPLVGRLADRWDRRRMLTAVTLLQAAALLPLLAVHGRADLPIVYATILAQAALVSIFDPAKNALLPTLLPADDLVSANSLVGLNQNLGRLVGGPLGGLLLAAGGLRVIVLADLASYLVSAALISRLRPTGPATATSTDVPTSRGFWSVARGRPIRAALVVTFIAQIAQGIFVVLFVLFVAQRLHGGSAEIGLLRGIQAVGAIAGGVVLGALTRACSPARLTAWAAFAFGIVELVLWNAPALSTATGLYVALFIVVGAPGVVLVTGIIGSLQRAGADHERGRIFGALGLASNAGQAVGMLAAGLLTAPLGLLTLLNAQALLYLGAGVVATCWMVDRVAAITDHAVDALPGT
ncbi:MAG TPA: MFS transporter [Mycobacteriales bacterium]|nr:MFS transporter [Mycobacteriales bacterium]